MFIYIFTICFHLNYVGRKFLYYNIRYYKVDVSIGLIHCSETESRLYKRIVVNNYYWGNTVTILKNLNMKRWLYVIYSLSDLPMGLWEHWTLGTKVSPPFWQGKETEINEDTYTQGNQFVITKKSNENDIERVQAEMSSKINIKGWKTQFPRSWKRLVSMF